MFLRKEIKPIKTGTIIVPFCNQCSSQDIEIIQTCKCCGSHDIRTYWDSFNDIRAEKEEYEDKEVYIFKCDKCNKEFDRLQNTNLIYYVDGEFSTSGAECIDSIKYIIQEDLCKDCTKKLLQELNNSLYNFIKVENINNLSKKFLNKGDE